MSFVGVKEDVKHFLMDCLEFQNVQGGHGQGYDGVSG